MHRLPNIRSLSLPSCRLPFSVSSENYSHYSIWKRLHVFLKGLLLSVTFSGSWRSSDFVKYVHYVNMNYLSRGIMAFKNEKLNNQLGIYIFDEIAMYDISSYREKYSL